jgi:RNA polymerase sigma-70 factor (ECF subfamily)
MIMTQATPEHQAHPRSASRPPTTPDDAVTWIVNEHGAAMLAYATRLTNDRAHAEDIVQEALIRAWRAWTRLDPDNGSIRGWLLTIIRNLVIDKSRARATRAPETHLTDWDDIGPATSPTTTIEDRAQITDLLTHLTPEERAVLIGIYLQDHTINQVAHDLGIAPGTVKSRMFYALRKLRPHITTYAYAA